MIHEFLLQQAEEQASVYLETHRIPDPYYFDVVENKVVSPNTGIPIDEVITRRTPVENVERNAFLKIQEWVAENSSGSVAWVCPPYKGIYDTAKITVSEIVFEGKKKRLLNRAIIIDYDKLGAVVVAKELARISLNRPNFSNASDVRRQPIFIDPKANRDLSSVLEQILSNEALVAIKSGADFEAKAEFVENFKDGRILSRGKYSESCPTVFNIFAGETFECPRCRGKIESGKGITECPHCGAKKADFTSVCV